MTMIVLSIGQVRKLRMGNAVLYTRVSTSDQKMRGYSLPDQLEKLENYCANNDLNILEHFEEDASARTLDRPKLLELFEYAKTNKRLVDYVLVVRYDRWSRGLSQSLSMIGKLRDMGIEFRAIEQLTDANTPESVIIEAIYQAVPEAENRRRAMNTSQGMMRALRDGRWVSKPAIGYKMASDESGKSFLKPDDQAPFVQMAFEMVAAGGFSTYTSIYIDLERKGFKCRKNQFFRMLDWLPYCGLISVRNKDGTEEFVEAIHEPLVKQELFFRVREIRHGRRHKKNQTKNSKARDDFPLRGHLLCPECGALVTASHSKGRSGNRYGYYHCHRCCATRISADIVNEKISNYLDAFEAKPEVAALYQAIIHDIFEQREGNRKSEIKRIDKAVQGMEDKKTRAADKLVEGHLEDTVYRSLTEDYNKQRQSLLAQKVELGTPESDFNKYVDTSLSLLTDLRVHYVNADVYGKQLILGSIFPEKLIFDGKSFRTTKPNTFVDLICRQSKHLASHQKKKVVNNDDLPVMVARTGFEPVLPA